MKSTSFPIFNVLEYVLPIQLGLELVLKSLPSSWLTCGMSGKDKLQPLNILAQQENQFDNFIDQIATKQHVLIMNFWTLTKYSSRMRCPHISSVFEVYYLQSFSYSYLLKHVYVFWCNLYRLIMKQ